MNEKLEQILLAATGWLTARQIADKGGWRSPAHVGVSLRHMETAGTVVRRESPTEKNINGTTATEWRHQSKDFGGDTAPARAKKRAAKPQPGDQPAQPATDLLILLADIRAAAGDPRGRLMQDALVAHITTLRQRANSFEQVSALADRAHDALSEVIETGDIEPAEMELDELAKRAAADLANARALNEKMLHLLDSARNELNHLRAHHDTPAGITPGSALECLQAAIAPLGEDAVLIIHPGGAFVRYGDARHPITPAKAAKLLNALATLHELREPA